jgi:hypothetical protein
MSSGFVEFTATYDSGGVALAAPAAGAHVAIALQKPSSTTDTVWFQDLPTGTVKWSHIEIIIENDDGADISGHIGIGATGPFISWDSSGSQIAAGPPQGASGSELVLVEAPNRRRRGSLVLVFDVVPTTPFQLAGIERNKLYLWLCCSASNSPKLVQARLYWHELTKG